MKTTIERLREHIQHSIEEMEREEKVLEGRISEAQAILANLNNFETQEKLKDV